MSEDLSNLLKSFTRDRSETAFRALVRRHSPLVFGTALRFLKGDRAAAQDVMQEVFTLLVRKAALLEATQIPGWLYRQTCRRASNHVRAESRRKVREQAAVAAMSPSSSPSESESHLGSELDEAMVSLPDADRDALVLRYFEDRDFRSVGTLLGITEEAARKRVNRAMDKLVALLKRRGIAVGAGGLGTTMSSMGRTPVPESLVSHVSIRAIQALPASGSGALLSFLKPFIAGLLASSVVAVSHRHAQADSNLQAASPASAAVAPVEKPGFLSPLPSAGSLDDIIVEIKRVKSGPANSFTALRLSAILGRVSNEEISAFIAIADAKLSSTEKASTYTMLLERWLKADPAAAIAFTAEAKIGEKINALTSTNLLSNLFGDWVERDWRAAAEWLSRHREIEALSESTFSGNQRDWMAKDLIHEISMRGSKEDLTRFIDSLPDTAAQLQALEAMGGNSPWHQGLFINAKQDRLLQCHQALLEISNADVRRVALANFWTSMAENRPQDLAALKTSLGPEELFRVSLGELGAQHERTGDTPLVSGGRVGHSRPVGNRDEREAATMQAGLEAGLSREEILQSMAGVLVDVFDHHELMDWLDRQQEQINLDYLLAARARRDAGSNGSVGNERFELIGILRASRISDPELRDSICRGAFLRMLNNDREAAIASLSHPRLPQDLAAEFRNIIEGENP